MFLLVILLLISCHNRDNVSCDTNSKNAQPFDSAQAIAKLHIKESVDKLELLSNDFISGLNFRVDTLELMYAAFACDCQQWVDPIAYQSADSNTTFDQQKYSWYIEAAHPELALDWHVFVSGNIIRFIGKQYVDIGYPERFEFIDPNPPKGKVFRYYKYEIVKPYKLWGPDVFVECQTETGDSLFVPIKLLVK